MTELAFYAFLLVFVRCSAMLLSSPVFGAQTTPLIVRIFTTLALSGALTFIIQPHMGPIPTSLYDLSAGVLKEAFAGILLGGFVNLSVQALQIAGGLMDLQTGLSASQSLNPLTGVQTSVLSQFKFMLGTVVFLAADGHHLLLAAFVKSYGVMPTFGAVEHSYVGLLSAVFLIALQIAAPVMAIGFLVDAALALMTRAVPQMQAVFVGMPAKIGAGLFVVALTLPAAVGGVNAGLGAAMRALRPLFRF